MELIVDNFAGGGGASTGIELATGRSVDIAINHDPTAIAMHRANHPSSKHYCENVWDVDPVEACAGRPVGLAWFSPDCKHFSKAKGGKPVEKAIRGLAWVAIRWAKLVRPRVIILENVEEFTTWGPLIGNRPDPTRKGQTFRRFVHALKRYGYRVEWNELRACDYGAPTIRKRFFLVARCDGLPIVWPEPTHGDPSTLFVASGILHPWRTSAEIIDWTIPCPSIYDRKKPLCENTMRRIARGLRKFVLEHPQPYIVDYHIAPFLIQYHTEQSGKEVRGQAVDKPLMTADSSNRYGLVTALLIKYYGQGEGQTLTEPLHTITTRDRFGVVAVCGELYQVTDIGMRMLTPRELFRAQGFPESYIIDRDADGRSYPKSAQVARCGNAVPPPFAEALVRANLPELCGEEERESA
ncbi:DNA cytosine methyltransferase [Selenomonas sp. oral taxon 149]|uniref:DNA cytosine methyltransferase n=1 Tax=Selenomonas sp. oral taxon 149 TaxID=712535 RepID=UPI0001E0A784|nr:DNA cytosine methyltransferase [Selenomonas sp. oral taxon 149]EFM23839.1 C-5 cytosine-specific DNA methylase [Selenomonas sp. oral taxon 149 str. 67H29BP]